MLEAGKTNPEIQKRCDYYLYRAPEEFYVVSEDPAERINRIEDPTFEKDIATFKKELEEWLADKKDPLLEQYREMGEK